MLKFQELTRMSRSVKFLERESVEVSRTRVLKFLERESVEVSRTRLMLKFLEREC